MTHNDMVKIYQKNETFFFKKNMTRKAVKNITKMKTQHDILLLEIITKNEFTVNFISIPNHIVKAYRVMLRIP